MDFSELSFHETPHIKIKPPGPLSKRFIQSQKKLEGSAVSYPRGLPMAMKRAKGATVEDVDGNRYIDFFGGAGVMNVGHANPDVLKAVSEQLPLLTHALDIPNPARHDLVEKLHSILPQRLDRVLFGGPTGSDAVELAVKLAKFCTKRHPIIAFSGSYHGMTSGALAMCSGRLFKEPFLPLLSEIHFVPYAYCYRCAFGRTSGKCDLECVKYLEYTFEDPHSGVSRPAAVIVESIQGEGGSIIPPDGFILALRELCTKYEVLLIDDEIQAGFCRTGKMFACDHTGIVPDIMTMSKALGGIGLPLSGIAYSKELDRFSPGQHIGTFRGNVLAYAAGAAAITFMKTTRLADHANSVGNRMIEQLRSLEETSNIIGEVRGKGLMLGVEFVTDKASKDPAPKLAANIRTECHRRGLLIEIGGHYFNVARFLPPLVLTPELADRGVELFAESVAAVERSR